MKTFSCTAASSCFKATPRYAVIRDRPMAAPQEKTEEARKSARFGHGSPAGTRNTAATRSIAGRMVASEASAPEIDLAARSRIGSGGARMLVSKDPLMYPLIRCLSRYCPPEVANAILARRLRQQNQGSSHRRAQEV